MQILRSESDHLSKGKLPLIHERHDLYRDRYFERAGHGEMFRSVQGHRPSAFNVHCAHAHNRIGREGNQVDLPLEPRKRSVGTGQEQRCSGEKNEEHAHEQSVSRAGCARFRCVGEGRIEVSMQPHLACFNPACRARFAIDKVIYNCSACGALLETKYEFGRVDAAALKCLWRERRMDNAPLSQSGVWRYREMFPFLPDLEHVITLREGNTPLLNAPRSAAYSGLAHLTFKHQGFNPTGSFKDNGMTCGASQAKRLGMRRVACVSTGNTSASMAAYASAGGLDPLIFIPHGNISYGKLAQALEYGAKTFQVEANFDQILALVRQLAERIGVYLLNSINPFRIEGQKSIVIEMLDQRDWRVPDWIVLPGGNLGNVSAFGKGLREMREIGLIDRLPRLAVVQAEGSSPFYEYMAAHGGAGFRARENPETLATAIRIGDPVSWPKAQFEIESSRGTVERASEQEIADAKAIVGQSGIGCEPASAATVAGIRKLTGAGIIDRDADVVAVLTGNVLKDPDYIYRYHTGQLRAPDGRLIQATFGNKPVVVPNDPDRIAELIGGLREKPV